MLLFSSCLLEGAAMEPLASTNALFSRHIYEKDEKGNEVERETVARTLLIFLDDSERFEREEMEVTGIQAVTKAAMAALIQKPCPILISGALLYNIFNDQNNKVKGDFVKQFDSQEWLIKLPFLDEDHYNKPLFLMIPKSYIVEKAAQQGYKSKKFDDFMKEISAISENRNFYIDKFLGLRISSMVNIVNLKDGLSKYVNNFPKGSFATLGSSEWAFAALIATTPQKSTVIQTKRGVYQFFIAPFEYKNDINNVLPQWNIYIKGHGHKGIICGVKNEIFSNFLDVLNAKIITKFLVYESCYSVGNRAQVYGEETKYISSLYYFPIIALGIGDSAVANSVVLSYRYFFWGALYVQGISFEKFTRLAEMSNSMGYPPIQYHELLRTVSYYFDQFMQHKMALRGDLGSAAAIVSSFASIRFPNSHTFFQLLPMFTITQRMVDARNQNQALDVREFIQKNIEPQFTMPQSDLSKNRSFFIVLDAQYISFDCIITTNSGANNFFIISTLTGDYIPHSLHIFDKTVYFDDGLSSFFNMFNKVAYRTMRIFYIKNLIVRDQVWVGDQLIDESSEYSDVIVYVHPFSKGEIKMEVFYTSRDGKKYSEKSSERPIEITHDYLKIYAESVDSLRNEFKKRREKMAEQSKVIEKGFKKAALSLNADPLVDLSNSLLLLAQQ